MSTVDLQSLNPVSLARFTIDKYGADADKPSVHLAKALLDGAHERDALRTRITELEHALAAVQRDANVVLEQRREAEGELRQARVDKDERLSILRSLSAAWDAYRAVDLMHDDAIEERDREAERERDRYHAALEKISAIRDSIVGMQGFDFSEHAYPLVAVLDAAGFPGSGYEISRKNLGKLIEQVKSAEADRDRLAAECERMRPVYEAAVEWRGNEQQVEMYCDTDQPVPVENRQAEWQTLDALREAIAAACGFTELTRRSEEGT